MIHKLLLRVVIIFCTIIGTHAQDIQFSMFYAVPLYLNPAFAGSRHANRAMLHHRWQWPNQEARYTTSMFSFDTYSMKYKSGIGGYIIQDYQGGSSVSSTHLMLQYAYEVRLNSSNTIRFGLQGGFYQSNVVLKDLVSQFSNNGPTNSEVTTLSRTFPDISFGVLWYAKRLYSSLSLNHLNRPNTSVVAQYAPYPVKMTLTAGYKIPLVFNTGTEGMHNGNPVMMALTPTITFKKQFNADAAYVKASGSGDQVDIGLYWTYKWLISGIWYRGLPLIKQYDASTPNNESIVLLIGASYLGFGFGYSYDITVSTQGTRTGGAHEINLSYVFRTKGTKKPVKSLPCPDFEYDILRRGSAGRVK